MEQLREAMIQTFNKKVQDGFVQKTIETQIEGFIQSTVKDLCSSWGDFSKALKENLTKDLCSRVSKLSLEQYNSLLIGEIQKRLDDVYVANAKKHMKELLDSMFKKPKERYKLSEIVAMIIEESYDSGSTDNPERGTLHVDDEYSSVVFIYIDPEAHKSKYDCRYRLTVDDKGNLTSAHKVDYRGKRPIRPDSSDIWMGQIDSLLFQAIVYGVHMEIDQDEAESATHYPGNHD